jgi:CBS domain containing-hemolysin-like protein
MAYLILGVVCLMGIVLLKAYTHIPQAELRRRARTGDSLAGLLFKAASYGPSLEIILWTIIGISATAFFFVVDRSLPGWMAIMSSLTLLWLGFAWIPNTPVSNTSLKLAKLMAAPLSWILQRVYPLSNWFANRTGRFRLSFHTGLYEKEDLVDFLQAQAGQSDSRISQEELTLARNSLTFGDKIIRSVMTPIGHTKVVLADDSIGPVLMSELHESGHTIFPVRIKKRSDEIVGVLSVHDIEEARAGGLVKDFMRKKINYISDEVSLDVALKEFVKTRHHLFVVKNNLEEVVGVVTVDDILGQIVGQSIDSLSDADQIDQTK